MTSISIIIPTLGRPTLERSVSSALAAMGPVDELVVVGDGPQPDARRIMAEVLSPRVRYMETIPSRAWGCLQYDVGSAFALGDFLLFSTDDDLIYPTACEDIRTAVEGKADRVHIFRIHWLGTRTLGFCDSVCNVSAQQIVVPNGRLASWSKHSASRTNDHEYLQDAIALWGRKEYHSAIIGNMPQSNNGRERP